jgi:hypothetical protein
MSITIEKSSGNVYADLGLADKAATAKALPGSDLRTLTGAV